MINGKQYATLLDGIIALDGIMANKPDDEHLERYWITFKYYRHRKES